MQIYTDIAPYKKMYKPFILYLRVIIISILLFRLSICNGQDSKLDSVLHLINTSHSDTIVIKSLNTLAWEIRKSNIDSSIVLSNLALAKALHINNELLSACSYYQLGILYRIAYNFHASLDCNIKAYKLFEKIYPPYGQIECVKIFNSLGLTYKVANQLSKALNCYLIALEIAKTHKDSTWIINLNGNISNIYAQKSMYKESVSYLLNALSIAEGIKNKDLMAGILLNLGIIYYNQKDYKSALIYFHKSLSIKKYMPNKELEIAMIYCNLGNIHADTKNFPLAISYYNMALKEYLKYNQEAQIADILGNIGSTYLDQKNYAEGMKYINQALDLNQKLNLKDGIVANQTYLLTLYNNTNNIAKAEQTINEINKHIYTLQNPSSLRDFYYLCFETYKKKNDDKKALHYFYNYIQLRDSITNTENIKEQISTVLKYEYDKKSATQKAEQEKKDIFARQEKKKQKIITYFISGIGLLILCIAFIIYLSFKKSQEKNKIISNQKKIVEDKNKDILDSINYAKRIQDAILPNESFWYRSLPESFVLYSPKDIIAGDFYWIEEFKNQIYVAVADCTGHGVPGAMVSVICSNALTKCLIEEHIEDTNKLLDRVREVVIEKLTKNNAEIKDGMDICLIRINKQTREIQYSGANRSLYIIQNNILKELKPNKQPIGNFYKLEPFSCEIVQIDKNDTLYLHTDGFADQFGGLKDKKLGTLKFKELLTSLHQYPLTEQKEKLLSFFNNWKGSSEQIDDITIIGLKV